MTVYQEYYFRMNESLCVKCPYALPNDYHECPWADHGEPVRGWKAKETKPGNFQVISCPDFPEWMSKLPAGKIPLFRPKFETEGMIRLLEAALKLARKDYIENRNHDRAACLDFIRKFVPDSDKAIADMNAEAKKFDQKIKKVLEP